MASFLQSVPVSSALRKQSTSVPRHINALQSISSLRKCSSFSTLCSSSKLTPPQHHISSSQYCLSKFPVQQRRTFIAQLKRQAQTLKATAPSTGTIPPAAASLQLTNLPYFVRRSASNQLPVYLETKAGGTKQLTKIQKTEGDLDALRSDLACFLGLESGDPRGAKSPNVTINRLNGHIIVKGWRKPEILKFLLERSF